MLALGNYIRDAKRRREQCILRSSKKHASAAAEFQMSISEQLMVRQLGLVRNTKYLATFVQLPIGKMYHCHKRGRGILKRGIPPTNINFNQSCNYQHVLERCKNLLGYTDEEKKKCYFYLADAKGVPIWTSDEISVDEEVAHSLEP